MEEEWGPWIEHDGLGCPCVGEVVQLVDRMGETVVQIAWAQPIKEHWNPFVSAWAWAYRRNIEAPLDVLRYRIRKPRGLTILERVAREVEREDA